MRESNEPDGYIYIATEEGLPFAADAAGRGRARLETIETVTRAPFPLGGTLVPRAARTDR